jgi:hypothetical protein
MGIMNAAILMLLAAYVYIVQQTQMNERSTNSIGTTSFENSLPATTHIYMNPHTDDQSEPPIEAIP